MAWLRTFASLLRAVIYGWIVALYELLALLIRLCRKWHRHEEHPDKDGTCHPVDHPAFLRPEPLLYSQRALMAQGLAVTWDNPDIQLFRGGVPVPSSQLQTSTTYDVQVRVWNNSLDAPAVHLPVRLSYLDFGIGNTPIPIASTNIDVGVKGSATAPAFATISWTTPPAPGHYCLQALLDPVDDLDFTNNLGQENTDVAQATSPADFTFTLRNDTRRGRRYRFETDAYTIPALAPCGAAATAAQKLERHRRGTHPLPPGFSVEIDPPAPSLQPDESVTVRVRVTPPAAFTGRQPVNVNAFHERGFAGGVTLIVTKGV